MADPINKPFVDETRYLKFYNGTGSAIGANIVLVPDAATARGAKIPVLSSVIKEIVGVTQRGVPAAAEGEVIAVSGDIAVCTANGAITKGDRVYVTTTSSHLGQVSTFTGVKTNGAQFVLGIAQDDAADGSLVAVRLAPHRVSEGRQSGVATLVAGTVTVSGVRISGTTCRINVTHNTTGGTIGHLSVPSASRLTAGTFVISSSTNADTSTVDWEIVDDD